MCNRDNNESHSETISVDVASDDCDEEESSLVSGVGW